MFEPNFDFLTGQAKALFGQFIGPFSEFGPAVDSHPNAFRIGHPADSAMQDGKVDLPCTFFLFTVFHTVEKLAANAFRVEKAVLLRPGVWY